MNVLGISAFYHDSAACLVRDGEIIAAAQEERFSRVKHDPNFPLHAIAYCLKEGGISIDDVDYVAFYEKPFLKFERLLSTYLAYAPRGFASFIRAMPLWLKQRLWLKEEIRRKLNYKGPIIFPEHHESHAASAFYPSPFQEAAFLTVDAVGEWTTTSYGVGKDNRLRIIADIQFPHSLGMFYSAFTYYTGFKVNDGEYKVMGLAPYGEPRYKELILENLIDLKEDGSFRLNMDYFNYCAGLTMTSERFHELFGGPPRKAESPLTQRDTDLARSIQAVTEEVLLRMVRHVKRETGMRHLCLAGGVALNCVANAKILREGLFDDIWIQPASGDAGGALGAALLTWHQYAGNKRAANGGQDSQKGSLLGPQFSDEEIEAYLSENGIKYQRLKPSEIVEKVAGLINEGKVVGWFRGRMEFGPRALGARSILGDARSPKMQKLMNMKIKFRESFRPFAPSVSYERAKDYFAIDRPSPYMLLVADVKGGRRKQMTDYEKGLFGIDKLNAVRSDIPAVTHVDYSARLQTVHRETNPLYYALIEELDKRYECPVVVNTSFNVREEPIVCTPKDAYNCFMRTDMDYLIMGNCLLAKPEQKPNQPHIKEHLDIFQCPACAGGLAMDNNSLVRCNSCTRVYPVKDGIPLMFVAHGEKEKVTEQVKTFYEETPFPNYDGLETPGALVERARRSQLARLLNESIPFHARVLEVGCGTGQMTNYLALAHRFVFGSDISFNSLELGQDFKEKFELGRAGFYQMNLFRPIFKPESFDAVIANGVLHHTDDPFRGFETISRLVKKGGYIVIGLYNTYGRIATDIRRIIFKLTGDQFAFLDPYVRSGVADAKRKAWFQDQYKNPHESKHTIGEVLGWFDAASFDFVCGIPSPKAFEDSSADDAIAMPRARGNRIDHAFVQFKQMLSGSQEGGFFVMIGKKR